MKIEQITTRATAYPMPALWRRRNRAAGKVRPLILLWALGVPLPIIGIIFLVRGCS